ncbi:putative extracellular lipase [Halenospora varia]|nr:putative extracellular lipase [Halenospora varia]
MPSITQFSLLGVLPIIVFSIFYSSVFQDVASVYFPSWTASSSTIDPQIKLQQGLIIGTFLNENFPAPIEAFLGFPYSQAPTGDRRFRRAVPLPPSNDTFEAKKYGAICPGKQLLSGKTGDSSEDCMTVNIFRQKPATDGQKVPVAVYIHGGAFNRGSSMMHNTGSMVAWSEKPFIGVSFNYRIGSLGFLPSSLTFKENIVNIGLHDQVFLLQWVQDNIEAFGGDPEDVTIFGLSAGAHSIGHHLLNFKEGVKALFHKAILESGAPTSRAVHPPDASVHEDQFNLFLEETACAGVAKESTMSCLRKQPSSLITQAQTKVFDKYNPSLRWAFQPVIDGEIIHQRPIDAWKTGKWNKVPIMTGHATNEGTFYVPRNIDTSEGFTDFFHTLLPHFSAYDLAKINKLYPDPLLDATSKYLDTRDLSALGIQKQFKRLEQAYAHYAYVCPVRQTGEIVSADKQSPPVWVFHWAVNSTVLGGANHGDNMYYQSFQESITKLGKTQREISGVYHEGVTSFITTGNPNTVKGRFGDRPEWESYGGTNGRKVMTFGKGNDERAGGSSRGVVAEMRGSEWVEKECEFWWGKSGDTEE